ncbi:uncharacterized protein LTHEOB_3193 [Lasiodiplodia theobromae]|uniref:uncharacterized protein n=1 Tax=Lasiodiplodia theobromae TaxID=45133 RepID=UPI0015C31CF3|nr:uncharacterized protein LTHEOB_3193 [Lasiodiplodia theobromae]KAF4534385.1 hypothetical protein LTHEOB_3193 [Lasiodiplodia theobromae]
MPPRIRLPSASTPSPVRVRTYNHAQRLAHYQQSSQCSRRTYASLATATTPAPSFEQATQATAPIARHPPTQPPSYKPADFRKTQLMRQYTSLLRSTPLTLLFQHNNLRAVEWTGIRRELAKALRKVDEELAAAGNHAEPMENSIKIHTVQTGIFRAALRLVEFYDPVLAQELASTQQTPPPSSPATQSSKQLPASDADYKHTLSTRAHTIAGDRKKKHELEVLLSGPIATVTFPVVSPQHLAAALCILAPKAPDFPAPRRKANPDYHEPAVQAGLQKLMLLGARVEGKVFDQDGTRWVGGIKGGLDGLRAQLVHMLQNAGAQVTNALEGASRSLYFTVESRRLDMEEKENPTKKEGEGSA